MRHTAVSNSSRIQVSDSGHGERRAISRSGRDDTALVPAGCIQHRGAAAAPDSPPGSTLDTMSSGRHDTDGWWELSRQPLGVTLRAAFHPSTARDGDIPISPPGRSATPSACWEPSSQTPRRRQVSHVEMLLLPQIRVTMSGMYAPPLNSGSNRRFVFFNRKLAPPACGSSRSFSFPDNQEASTRNAEMSIQAVKKRISGELDLVGEGMRGCVHYRRSR